MLSLALSYLPLHRWHSSTLSSASSTVDNEYKYKYSLVKKKLTAAHSVQRPPAGA